MDYSGNWKIKLKQIKKTQPNKNQFGIQIGILISILKNIGEDGHE